MQAQGQAGAISRRIPAWKACAMKLFVGRDVSLEKTATCVDQRAWEEREGGAAGQRARGAVTLERRSAGRKGAAIGRGAGLRPQWLHQGVRGRTSCRPDGNPAGERRLEGHADQDGPPGCGRSRTPSAPRPVHHRSACAREVRAVRTARKAGRRGSSRARCPCAGYCGTLALKRAPLPWPAQAACRRTGGRKSAAGGGNRTHASRARLRCGENRRP